MTLCELDNFETVPTWGHIPYSFPFSPQCKLRGKFVVSQCSHDARRELDLSLSRIEESIKHQIDPSSIRLLYMIHANSACTIQDSFRPVRQTLKALVSTGDLTDFEVLLVHHAVDNVLRFFAELVVRVILP